MEEQHPSQNFFFLPFIASLINRMNNAAVSGKIRTVP